MNCANLTLYGHVSPTGDTFCDNNLTVACQVEILITALPTSDVAHVLSLSIASAKSSAETVACKQQIATLAQASGQIVVPVVAIIRENRAKKIPSPKLKGLILIYEAQLFSSITLHNSLHTTAPNSPVT